MSFIILNQNLYAMRKILILLVICVFTGCKSKKDAAIKPEPKVARIAEEKIDTEQKDRITALGKQILMTCNTSKFKPFTEKEATAEVRKNMTIQRLTKTCLKFRLKYGDFKDLKFVESYHNKTDKTTIFRYKALYEKKIANKELRITVNENDQIAAVNSKDWKDDFIKPEAKPKTDAKTTKPEAKK